MPSRDGIQERRNYDGSISYRAQVRMRGFQPLSKTFRRKTDAKRWIEETKTKIRGGNMVSNEASRTTLREALNRYKKEITPNEQGVASRAKKGWKRETERIDVWMSHPLTLRFLSQLRGSDFAEY